ncbi:alpha/beta hydrolase [Tomitella biformata]|uniref:alpha/beta hydrolase n=1 Tax=Tomitella biformata TaxID=630403 RepID=UPI0004657CC8|nr:alpha/beta hydrolase family protein [Tomitella biformata]
MRSEALQFRRRLRATALAAVVLGSLLAAGPTAVASPATAQTSTAVITRVEPITDRQVRVFIDSPAMQGEVQVQVLLPRDATTARPTVYLLDGRSATPGTNNWIEQGEAVEFFEDKPVNAVITTGGRASYYTDWQQTDPVLGHMKWETFLTQELPPLIDARFNGNGAQSLVGLSMGAHSAMMLAFRNPELYSGVAAFSGCYETDNPIGFAQMGLIIDSYDGNIHNMWGPLGDPDWAAHDVFRHAEQLRGMDIYVSTATGLPGYNETLDNPDLLELVAVGGPLEAVSYACTRNLDARLSSLSIPATFVYNDSGVHTWAYWRDELPKSWPTLARSLGI